MKKTAYCSILAALFSGTQVKADDTSRYCVDEKTVVVFTNGVNTDLTKTRRSAQRLQAAILRGSGLSRDDLVTKYEFDYAYNPTDGLLLDLWESTKQDLAGDTSQFIRYVRRLVPMPDWFAQKFAESAQRVDDISRISVSKVQAHTNKYISFIDEGKRVIVVPHSQGNFYFNSAYTGIPADKRSYVTAVSVANPDNVVKGGGSYTTETRDMVINLITAAKSSAGLPSSSWPLAGNVTNSSLLDFPMVHGFKEAYLAGSATRGKILGDFTNAANTLPYPAGIVTSGIITVRLDWDSQPDVDLHVFEPGGAHVYYRSRQGVNGYLDKDDTSSYGPEHYYVGCDTISPGVYRVGVNYYSGSAATSTKIQLSAGLSSATISKVLPIARGSSGNNSPIPVADIVVSGTKESGFTFDIR